jgi:surface carbohydrate biosynthesis protein (TIGR04326 family)
MQEPTNNLNHITIRDLYPNIKSKKRAQSSSLTLTRYHLDEEYNDFDQYIDNNRVAIRSHYLEWLSLLATNRVDELSLIEKLAVRPHYSLWYSSLLSETSNISKSPYINRLIDLISIHSYLHYYKPDHITLRTSDRLLYTLVNSYCETAQSTPTYILEPPNIHHTSNLSLFISTIGHRIYSLLWLFQRVLRRFPLISSHKCVYKTQHSDFIFLSYLFNLTEKPPFVDNYWGKLPEKLSKLGFSVNFLHIFFENQQVKNSFKALRTIWLLNNKSEYLNQTHLCLDSFISLKVCLKIIKDWYRISSISPRSILSSIPPLDGVNISSLLIDDLLSSIYGKVAIMNCYYLNLFEEALKYFKPPTTFIYLYENQDWEYSLLHVAQLQYFSKCIAFQHASVRFWDLRFYHSHSLMPTSGLQYPLPIPNILAVSTKTSYYLLSEFYRDTIELQLVEPLRFMYLNSHNDIQVSTPDPNLSLPILIIGDSNICQTKGLLNLLNNSSLLYQNYTYIFRPHPLYPFASTTYKNLLLTTSTEPLSTLIFRSCCVLVIGASSSVYDAILLKRPAYTYSPETTNLSPLYGTAYNNYFSTSSQLLNLLSIQSTCDIQEMVSNSFTFDSNLSHWMNILL